MSPITSRWDANTELFVVPAASYTNGQKVHFDLEKKERWGNKAVVHVGNDALLDKIKFVATDGNYCLYSTNGNMDLFFCDFNNVDVVFTSDITLANDVNISGFPFYPGGENP